MLYALIYFYYACYIHIVLLLPVNKLMTKRELIYANVFAEVVAPKWNIMQMCLVALKWNIMQTCLLKLLPESGILWFISKIMNNMHEKGDSLQHFMQL